MPYKLDMTMMFVVHDALRRDLTTLARVTASRDDDPRRVLRAAAGWEMFKAFLRVHHTAEDVSVWAPMAKALTGRPDDLALLDAMEAEHAAIDPLLAAVDAAIADPDGGPQRLGDAADALRTGLAGHLRHEETEGLRLVDAVLTPEQWAAFGADHRARIGPDATRYLPWLLDGATPEVARAVLGRMPEPLRTAYAEQWRVAYAGLPPWPAAAARSGPEEAGREGLPPGDEVDPRVAEPVELQPVQEGQ